MGDVFIGRLRGLNGAAHDQLAASLKAAAQTPALVRSAFDLPPAQRTAIQAAVGEIYGAQTPLRFETAPNLISGIELTTNGQKVAWSISQTRWRRWRKNVSRPSERKSDRRGAATHRNATRDPGGEPMTILNGMPQEALDRAFAGMEPGTGGLDASSCAA